MATLIGQRWLYRIGNSTVCVDNAFAWSGWGQERLLVNEEAVQQSSGWFQPSQTFAEPWLTRFGDDELAVRLIGRIMSVQCDAVLAGVPLKPDERLATRWRGPRGGWPDGADWRAARKGDFMALPQSSDQP
ncbi:MAG: hypothetical protein LKF80_11915 [Brevundimonas sp.]|uniref:hypothetical protein n=1 Tax=Brevundimonas sp. TaxID=1871086 RepID=UPI0025C263AD|nr:hypothetical protein [Brevundimonas sp.]MCH4269100.1 hypothetical protein [Brevundimonas sp.]